jgi:hypothetical protein
MENLYLKLVILCLFLDSSQPFEQSGDCTLVCALGFKGTDGHKSDAWHPSSHLDTLTKIIIHLKMKFVGDPWRKMVVNASLSTPFSRFSLSDRSGRNPRRELLGIGRSISRVAFGPDLPGGADSCTPSSRTHFFP